MSKSMKLSAFYEKPELLMKLFGWVSAGVMLFNMVLICCDVFMRYAFQFADPGDDRDRYHADGLGA